MNVLLLIVCVTTLLSDSYSAELDVELKQAQELLSEKDTKRHSNDKSNWQANIRGGVSSVIGRRTAMEDYHIATSFQGCHVFGVFDGHDGHQAASIVADHLPESLNELFTKRYAFLKKIYQATDDIESRIVGQAAHWALHNSFLSMEKKVTEERDKKTFDSGTTALVSLLCGKKLWVANAGDTRAVLSKKGQAYALSTDHSNSNPSEVERIKAAKWVRIRYFTDGQHYYEFFNNNTALSVTLFRSIGHQWEDSFPGGCIPDPEIESIELSEDTDFLIMACDGVWDRLTNQSAVWTVSQFLAENPDNFAGAAQFLQETAFDAGSKDNLTVMVIDLKSYVQKLNKREASARSSSTSDQVSSDSVILS